MSDIQDTQRNNRTDYRQDTVLEHEFDGIKEFDNRLPNWWLWIMWGSMIFALIYWMVFHTLEVRETPHERLEAVMLEAQEVELARMEAAGIDDAMLWKMSEMPNKVEEGRALFKSHCVACHLDQGQGSVGPNLTDDKWIHGCKPMELLDTVKNGVTAKGMPTWLNQLGPSRSMAVVSYVLTLRNTNVPGKAPEGKTCVE